MRKVLLTLAVILIVLPLGAHAAVVNINTATAAQLDTLPGIGPTKAAAIIDYRTTHGPFVTTEGIQEVKGIGPSTYAGLKDFISVTGASTPVQPKAPTTRSTTQQTTSTHVETANTTSVTEPAHAEEGVSAPRATAEAAALGAALPATEASVGSILSSVWMLGFLGIVVLAGAALLII